MIRYPETKKEQIEDAFFGVKVKDPYRWLEDDHSPETMEWVKKQQELTESVLNEYPERRDFLQRLKELNDYQKESTPVKLGEWYYFLKNDGLQNQWVIYRKRTLASEAELFFDPNTLSEDGTTGAYRAGNSRDYKYFVYMINEAGADAGEFWLLDSEKKEFLKEKLVKMKFTGASWYREGFFYSRFDNEEDFKQTRNQKVYYHKLGDRQEDDKLIYEDKENPQRFLGAYVSDDEKYLFIYVSEGTSGEAVIFKPLDDENAGFQTLFEGYEYDCRIYDGYEEDTFYIFTNKNAQNYRLLKVNLKSPGEENWEEIIPERDYLLEDAEIAGKRIIALFVKDVQSKIEILDPEGIFQKEIELPYQGSAYFVSGKKEDKEGFFVFTSFVRPNEVYHYDIPADKLTFYRRDAVKGDFEDIVSEQVFYESKDGCRVPMTLIHKKGIKKDGNNPVILYGYGGFNVSLMPGFSPNRQLFLEKGGIYVIANLRGGGEYGEKWHKDGMLLKKQNVFDDFIAAAEYLIENKYTNPEKIAINGGSNGGLLVGACMLQRPDLFKVAVPSMGVLDMLRFHKFTCGWGWMVEYGNPEEEEHFHNLLKYSPLHNVKEGVKYPATMVVTADHDDRVVPGHSFKFAAALQEKGDQELPLLLYTQIQSAHGASSMTKGLEMSADVMAFVCKYLRV
jgi:prolyl oligopeptidase